MPATFGDVLRRLRAHAAHGVRTTSFGLAKILSKAALEKVSSSDPVIVYTAGKVGSSAVAATLEALFDKRCVAHIHELTAERLQTAESQYRSRARANWGSRRALRFLPDHIWLGQHLSKAMSSAPPEAVWDVVTLVRDPVSRNVSSFFQNLELMFDFWPAEELKRNSAGEIAERLVEIFLDSYVAGNFSMEHDADLLTWFDDELKPVFGVDVYATPFPTSRGYEIYAGSNSRVLLMRTEDIDRTAQRAFSEFFGIDVVDLKRRNEATNKVYGDVYRQFKKRLSIPSQYLDRQYSSRYSQHFYTPAELAEFRARWQ
jgi:hypothetical protein